MRTIRSPILNFILVFCLVSPGWAAELQTAPVKPLVIKPTVQINPIIRKITLAPSRLALQTLEIQQLDTATQQLVTQNFANLVAGSVSVLPQVTVLGKEGNRIKAEALVFFLAKDTYTARISRLEYDVEGDTYILRNKVDDYVPPVEAIKVPGAPSPVTAKAKLDLRIIPRIAQPQGTDPLALANAPCIEFPSAVQHTNNIHNIFLQAFGQAEKKIGPESTKAAVLDILKNNTHLLAWNYIGHGNPYLITQWDTPLCSSDFSSPTVFSGIFDAVIMLTSCNTCNYPRRLGDAIMHHLPRTYIAGNKLLPVGPADGVAEDFWKYTLQINPLTMASAIIAAENRHGLAGYYCLFGYSGTFIDKPQKELPAEDCIPFDPAQVRLTSDTSHFPNIRWLVVSGTQTLLDCGTRKDVAQRAANIISFYKMDRQCYVGHPNAPMMYYTVNGLAPAGAFPVSVSMLQYPDDVQVETIAFNTLNVTATNVGGSWKVVDGPITLLDFGTMEAQARNAAVIIRYYGFTHICYVGRPNAPMMYFRK